MADGDANGGGGAAAPKRGRTEGEREVLAAVVRSIPTKWKLAPGPNFPCFAYWAFLDTYILVSSPLKHPIKFKGFLVPAPKVSEFFLFYFRKKLFPNFLFL